MCFLRVWRKNSDVISKSTLSFGTMFPHMMIVTVVIKIIMLFVKNKHQINNDAAFLSKTICISIFHHLRNPAYIFLI
jgi:hypothetical protein